MSQVILASASPRRRELLKELVANFDVVPSEVDEYELDDPWVTAERLATEKAKAVAATRPEAIVIGADTVVALEDERWRQLAKPGDEREARAMLRSLSGRVHFVITGVAVIANGRVETAHDTTRVSFRPLSDGEIADYVATGEPMDKAGAYAIQAGARGFVERIEGSISNVIGLPIEVLEPILQRSMATHGS